ncbi:MAG: hypothetical protein IPQ05_22080 [Leptospiraceae bacterium]|nr:hypothetical protein [Leptospiraceae bacterium]
MNNLRLSIKSNYPSSFKKFYFLKVIFILLLLCISCEKSKPDNTSKLLGLVAIVNSTKAQSYVVSTFAGSGEIGSVDGTGIAASFNYPAGIALDSNGNLYLTDIYYNHKIRKITFDGIVTTLAGSGSKGSIDGIGNIASFNSPGGIVVDKSGNVYVADTFNSKIRKITLEGVVSTLAGSGVEGFADGVGGVATFFRPLGVIVDGSGTVYVADTYNNKIRKIAMSGVVTTLAGSGASGATDGTGIAATLNSPQCIAMDSNGIIYVGDYGNHKVRKINSNGVVTTFAGSADNYLYPLGIAIDSSGSIYIAEFPTLTIRKISPAGVISMIAGSGSKGCVDGIGTTASFSRPTGIAVDNKGTIYIGDGGCNKIRKITLQ